ETYSRWPSGEKAREVGAGTTVVGITRNPAGTVGGSVSGVPKGCARAVAVSVSAVNASAATATADASRATRMRSTLPEKMTFEPRKYPLGRAFGQEGKFPSPQVALL